MAYYEVEDVYTKSLNLYQKNFLPVAVASIVLGIPALFFNDSLDQEGIKNLADINFLPTIMTIAYALVSQTLLVGFIIKFTMQNGMDEYRESLRIPELGWDWVGPALVVVIVESLMIFCGLMFLIIPGVILILGLAYTFPVLILEKEYNFFNVFGRSWELTSGDRFHIFVNVLIFWFISGIASYLLGGLFSLVGIEGNILLLIETLISCLIAPIAGYIYLVMYLGRRMHVLEASKSKKETDSWPTPEDNRF